MGYITIADFEARIQRANLDQITNNNTSIVDTAILLAEAELESYLIQKYDIQTEFSATGTTRNIQLITYGVDLALYHLHSRIAPKNVPELRVNNYNTAILWLKMCAYGDLNVAIKKLNPKQGMRIRYSSVPKNTNNY